MAIFSWTARANYETIYGRSILRHANGVWLWAGGSQEWRRSTDAGQTWSSVGSFGASMQDMQYAAGTWLAVGNGNIMRSSSNDGASWTQRYPGFWGIIYAAAYGAGTWLAVGEYGQVATSTDDCESWTQQTSGFGTSSPVRAAAYHAGRWVIVGAGGKIATSDDDGVTWTLRTSGTSADLGHVLYDADTGRWIVASLSGVRLLSSANAETWSLTTISTAGNVQRLIKIGGAILATGELDSIHRSTDGGVTWATITIWSGGHAAYDIASSGALILVVGSGSRMAHSDDNGLTWTAGDGPDISPYVQTLRAAHTAAGVTVITTEDGYIWTSPEYLGPVVSLGWPIDVSAPALSLPWPIEIAPPTTAAIGWPVEVAPAAVIKRTLPWRVTVSTPVTLSRAWPINVLSASAVGGLDGAGGWPAAPSGRWTPVVVLDGTPINPIGPITVDEADNAASTAEFSFRPALPLQPMSLTGRPVRIAFAERGPAGEVINAQTVFTGVVDVPSVDIATGVITCICTDQLQEIIANTPRDWLDANLGGRWRAEVSGEPADNWDYCEARRASVPASIALDALQQPRVIPWRGAGLRSYTVRDADHLEGLSVQLPSRADLRTRITCRLQYQYTALRARGAQAVYVQPLSFFVYQIFGQIYGRLWLTRAMVMGACESVSGWQLDGTVQIENPRPQTIFASGVGAGGYTITAQVAPDYVLSFRANFKQRWQQTVTEDYSITLVAPALEAQIGIVSDEIGATLRAEFDQPDWQTDDTVEPFIAAPAVGDIIQPWQPEGAAPSDRDACMRTLLDRAWVRLYDASRSGRVQFSLPLRPDLWLDAWLQVEAAHLSAAGKIIALRHIMDADNGSAVTDITVAVGLPGNTDAALPSWTLPGAPEDAYTPPMSAYDFTIGTYVGGEPLSPPFDEETMIGFCTNDANVLTDAEIAARNWYPHQLSMRPPALAAEDRDPRVLPAFATIETTIPTDTLEII